MESRSLLATDTEISCILIGLRSALPSILPDPKFSVMFKIVILMNIYEAVSHIAPLCVTFLWKALSSTKLCSKFSFCCGMAK